ncbi:hypothetical protein ACFSKL_10625, partial [Belliella marina]
MMGQNKISFLGMGILLFGLLVPNFKGLSQTVNLGELTVLPGTVVSTYFDLDNRESGKLINDGDLYLFASLNNDGEISFTEGEEGLTRFVGKSGIQQIMGTSLSRLKNVLFDNVHDQNAFHLFGDVSIAGVSRFVQGIVLADGNGGLMLFEKGGSHTQ